MSKLQYEKTEGLSTKFQNWRHYNRFVPTLKSAQIYRAATLSIHPDLAEAKAVLKEKNIKTVIDLRAPRELKEYPYDEALTASVNYVHAPFDPWDQPEWFVEKHHQGTGIEIAYRFFILACQPYFKQAIQAILDTQEGAVLVHCHAGKDRTGLLLASIQLLLGTDNEDVMQDYLASEQDTVPEKLNMLFDEIQKQGSIAAYFSYQGVDAVMQQALKEKLGAFNIKSM